MMKKLLAIALALSLPAAPAFANLELAKAKNCMTCHAIDKKVVGPAYKDVAAKYAGDKGAEDRLVQKVLKGSVGTWGQVAMPPNAVTDKEAHTLVQWVLNQK